MDSLWRKLKFLLCGHPYNKPLVLSLQHVKKSESYLLVSCIYYMALSHKDWELPNSRTWLAEMDIDHGLDFPI